MLQLTPTTEELLLTLTRRVPILTLPQVVRTWFGDSEDRAEQAASELAAAKLLRPLAVTARPELELTGPAFRWSPADQTPALGPLAYRLQTRWQAAPIEHQAFVATGRAKRLFGGYLGGRKPRPSELTHDIHLAHVYLRYRLAASEIAAAWMPEAEAYAHYRDQWDRLPDATIIDQQTGAPRLLVEFGGAYSKQKLEAFHAACHATAYEIW